MAKYRVVVTDQVFPDIDTERALLAEIDAEIQVARGDREEMLKLAGTADALLNTYAPFSASDLAQLSQCRIIARYGIGVDNIDLDAAREAGIAVTNVPDYCIEEVALHTVAMLLSLHRKVVAGDAMVRAGGWGIADLRPIQRISELTVGLVGYGQIARRVARVVDSLGARVVASDPYVTDSADATTMVELNELLETAHIVSLHAPLTDSTRGLISAGQLQRMRSDALLVNTSRGPLVEFEDLVQALRSGQIAGAGLDVLEQEPPDDPSMFHDVPNLVVTPHSAFYSDAAIRESQTKAATQIIKAVQGRDLDYQVN